MTEGMWRRLDSLCRALAWLIPARFENWVCDRYEDAIWSQFPNRGDC